jgi:tRNA-splicing ligase RtcB
MEEIRGGRVPVLSWAPGLEDGARKQALNCASLPVTHHHVAVMADGHQGYGVPIGAVLPMKDAISPYAVGNDIGCGMALVPTTISKSDLLPARDDLMNEIAATIPSGMSGRKTERPGEQVDNLLELAFDAMAEAAGVLGARLSTAQTPVIGKDSPTLTRDQFVHRGGSQAGTLGSGNHFVELLVGPDDDVWVMLHSGSRGVGSLVCNNYHRMALEHCAQAGITLPDPGLAYLPLDTDDTWSRVGECYIRSLKAALDFAQANRHRMLEDVATILSATFPGALRWDESVNIHHNDATLEEHYGEQVWVHRKGAVKASEGRATVTPGSMGTGSFLGRGRGEASSFSSCSHGAGRVMSRGQARRELSLDEQLRQIRDAGSKVYAANTGDVLDEMPGAYKDLDTVMAAQSDLVETVRRFTPLATYKGSDPPKFKKKKRSWRPEEER